MAQRVQSQTKKGRPRLQAIRHEAAQPSRKEVNTVRNEIDPLSMSDEAFALWCEELKRATEAIRDGERA